MLNSALIPVTFGAAYLGLSLLALTLERHRKQVSDRDFPGPIRVRACRTAAYLLLASSLAPAWLRDGPGFGVIVWVMLLSAAAVSVALTLTWLSRWLRPLARVACGLSRSRVCR